jgi:hypothetical protein
MSPAPAERPHGRPPAGSAPRNAEPENAKKTESCAVGPEKLDVLLAETKSLLQHPFLHLVTLVFFGSILPQFGCQNCRQIAKGFAWDPKSDTSLLAYFEKNRPSGTFQIFGLNGSKKLTECSTTFLQPETYLEEAFYEVLKAYDGERKDASSTASATSGPQGSKSLRRAQSNSTVTRGTIRSRLRRNRLKGGGGGVQQQQNSPAQADDAAGAFERASQRIELRGMPAAY